MLGTGVATDSVHRVAPGEYPIHRGVRGNFSRRSPPFPPARWGGLHRASPKHCPTLALCVQIGAYLSYLFAFLYMQSRLHAEAINTRPDEMTRELAYPMEARSTGTSVVGNSISHAGISHWASQRGLGLVGGIVQSVSVTGASHSGQHSAPCAPQLTGSQTTSALAHCSAGLNRVSLTTTTQQCSGVQLAACEPSTHCISHRGGAAHTLQVGRNTGSSHMYAHLGHPSASAANAAAAKDSTTAATANISGRISTEFGSRRR